LLVSFPQRSERQRFKVYAGFFDYMNVATGVTGVNDFLLTWCPHELGIKVMN